MKLILYFCFFLSGTAALIYQVIWQRLLTFFVGSDTIGISLIVTVFMLGLGIGSYVGGRWAARTSHVQRLRIFIIAELLIGLFGLFSKYLLYDFLYGTITIQSVPLVGTIICVVLFLPTFLMGVSLPVLAQTVTTALPDAGKEIGFLYAFNTLGAAAGAAMAAWLFIPLFGMESTLYLAALMNIICAGGTAWVLVKTKKKLSAQNEEKVIDSSKKASRVWWFLYASSGFVAIALEMLWFRLLGATIKSISITFPTLLSIYLLGLAIGTFVGIKALKFIRNKTRAYIAAQLGIVIYSGLSVIFWLYAVQNIQSLDFLNEYYASYEPEIPSAANKIIFANYLLIPLFVMGVPTVLMGFSFPILQSIVQQEAGNVGKFVGYLQALNIAGASLGALLTTFIAFPFIGSGGVLFFLVAIGILVWLAGYYIHRKLTVPALLGVACILLVLFLLPAQEHLWKVLHGSSKYKRVEIAEGSEGISAIKYSQSDSQSVVFSHGLGQGVLPYGNGDVHLELGAIPLFMHPSPADVAIIGLGSGGTLFGIAGREETKNIVCYEIMPHQYDLLEKDYKLTRFTGTESVISDKRVKFIFKDGRHGLQHSPQLFDIIQADALRPASAFAGNLYSVEYFQLLKSKLKKGGYAVTWVPTDRTKETFLKVFPYAIQCETTLIGSNEPIILDSSVVLRNAEKKFSHDYYKKVSVDIASGIRKALKVISYPRGNGKIQYNTDLFPRDEYFFDAFRKMLGFQPSKG